MYLGGGGVRVESLHRGDAGEVYDDQFLTDTNTTHNSDIRTKMTLLSD